MDSRVPAVGTKIVRQHGGREHVVVVARDGFEYRGRKYGSISAISTEIAGRRDGYLFFGLGMPGTSKTVDGAAVEKLSRTMARWFRRRGAPARVMDEVQSIAALSVVERHRVTGYALDARHWNYYFRAAMCDVAGEMKHVLAPFRMGGREARLGRFTIPHVKRVDDLEWMLGGAAGPEEELERAERERARKRVIARVLGHAQGLKPEQRRNVAHLLQEIAPGIRLPRRRPQPRAAWSAVRRLRNVVAKNPLARRDRCVMIGMEDLAA